VLGERQRVFVAQKSDYEGVVSFSEGSTEECGGVSCGLVTAVIRSWCSGWKGCRPVFALDDRQLSCWDRRRACCSSFLLYSVQSSSKSRHFKSEIQDN